MKPKTRPPLNATLKALFKLSRAYLQVLTLAFTAIVIPMYPQIIEVKAPSMKGTTV